jgi:hypothetical protein
VERLGRGADGVGKLQGAMDKSQMRVRPGFLLILLAIFALLGWLVGTGVPTEKEKTKAKVLETYVEERSMAELLEEKALASGGLTNVPNEFILNPFLITNKYTGISFTSRTNASGEVVDIWQTPFQITFVKQTNFIVRSAGPNSKFGDANDIVFNSVSRDFVKP